MEYFPIFIECLPIFLCLDKPKLFSFKRDQENNIVNVGETVKIICKAEGFPAPNYTIFHNCIKVTDNAVKIIKSVNIHDGGRYECVANNDLGQVSEILNLTVNWKTGKICLETNLCEMVSELCKIVYFKLFKWCYLFTASTGADIIDMRFILIAFICGIFVGVAIALCVFLLRRQWFKSKRLSKPACNHDTPDTDRESATDNSAYQELDLRNKDPENSYQALRMNTRRRIDNETNIEDEAGYQELDKVREKENNYQSLNSV